MTAPSRKQKQFLLIERTRLLKGCAVAILPAIGGLLVRLPLAHVLGDTVPYITFFPAIVMSAAYGGLIAGLVTTSLRAFAAVYLIVRQILLNLTGNAIKFTDHGEVQVVLPRQSDNGRPWTQVSVHDTGMGIRPEDQAKLFQAFTRAETNVRRRNEGAGLGLHLSQKLAQLLGGQINFKSEYGNGSTFTLSLPEGEERKGMGHRVSVPMSALGLINPWHSLSKASYFTLRLDFCPFWGRPRVSARE